MTLNPIKNAGKATMLLALSLPSFTMAQQVVNGDFEDLSPSGVSVVPFTCYWTPQSSGTPGANPQKTYTLTAEHVNIWDDYHSGGTQGIDYFIDAEDYTPGVYRFDLQNQVNCQSMPPADHFRPYHTPGKLGMLVDANPANGKSGYIYMDGGSGANQYISNFYNDFIQGEFDSKLDLFKEYELTFQYSIPCNDPVSTAGGKIYINLFDTEWIDHLGPQDYATSYLHYQSLFENYFEINNSSFQYDRTPSGQDLPGSRRLLILEFDIPAGLQPCEWHTETVKFSVAELMNDPNNNHLSTNSLYTVPVGFMHNGHLFDQDYFTANQNGWPYTYSSPGVVTASYMVDAYALLQFPLFDFKKHFGFTVKNAAIYLDDVSISEVGCLVDPSFIVDHECYTDENGTQMVTFSLTPTGTTSNPYMFFARDLPSGTFAQIGNTPALQGTHTYTVPYVAGMQYQFKCGSWAPNGAPCGWKETTQTHTIDPAGDWFPVNPDFTVYGIQSPILPQSMFAVVADPNPSYTGYSSTWEIQVYYNNGTNSAWLALPNNGNSQLLVWFDCEDAFSPIVNPPSIYSNVHFVKVRRTNFGSCDAEGWSLTRLYVNCEESGKSLDYTDITMDQQILNIKDANKQVENLNLGFDVQLITNEEQVGIYPNPTNGRITLNFESDKIRSITVYSITGKKVIDSQQSAGLQHELTLENLEPGVYSITILDGTQTITKKVIKQ